MQSKTSYEKQPTVEAFTANFFDQQSLSDDNDDDNDGAGGGLPDFDSDEISNIDVRESHIGG